MEREWWCASEVSVSEKCDKIDQVGAGECTGWGVERCIDEDKV